MRSALTRLFCSAIMKIYSWYDLGSPQAGHPPGLSGFCQILNFFYYSIEAQWHALYRGRFAFVRQVECAHKTKPRGESLGYKGRILGLLVFGVVAISRFGGF